MTTVRNGRSLGMGAVAMLLFLALCHHRDRRTADAFVVGVPSAAHSNRAVPSRAGCALQARRGGSRRKGKTGSSVPPGRIVARTEYVTVDADGEDAWKLMDIVDVLTRGGVGIVPTDTGYAIVTTMDSKTGLDRLLRIKQQYEDDRPRGNKKKPLSVLCSSLSTVDGYCYGIDRTVFKILKKNLPGPYTFILPASTSLPKGMVLTNVGGRQSWARGTVGIRMPDDPVLRYLQDELLDGMPLLVSSVPKRLLTADDHDDDDDDDDDAASAFSQCSLDPAASWCNKFDFIVDAGARAVDASTIYDLTARGEPALIREGTGEAALAL